MPRAVYTEKCIIVGDYCFLAALMDFDVIAVERLPIGGNEFAPKSHRVFLSGEKIPRELGLSK